MTFRGIRLPSRLVRATTGAANQLDVVLAVAASDEDGAALGGAVTAQRVELALVLFGFGDQLAELSRRHAVAVRGGDDLGVDDRTVVGDFIEEIDAFGLGRIPEGQRVGGDAVVLFAGVDSVYNSSPFRPCGLS